MPTLNVPVRLTRQEQRLTKKIAQFFKKLANTVKNNVEQGELDNDIAIQLWFEKAVPEIVNDIHKTHTFWSRVINQWLELGIDTWLINTEAVKYIRWLKDLMLSNRDGSITRTTKDTIKEVIAQSINDGSTYQEAAQKIIEQTDAGIFSPQRAQLIAVREIGHAYEQWRKVPIDIYRKQTGAVVEKHWDTVGDDKVTEECRENEAKWWITFNEARPSWDIEAPRNSNPRCRCTTNYRIL